jgi:hypothetical protein
MFLENEKYPVYTCIRLNEVDDLPGVANHTEEPHFVQNISIVDDLRFKATGVLSPFMRLCTFGNPAHVLLAQVEARQKLFGDHPYPLCIIIIASDQAYIMYPGPRFTNRRICQLFFCQKFGNCHNTKKMLIPFSLPLKGSIPIYIDSMVLYLLNNTRIYHLYLSPARGVLSFSINQGCFATSRVLYEMCCPKV